MKRNKLEPCHRCGCAPKTETYSLFGMAKRYFVQCPACGLQTEAYKNKEEAEDAWRELKND